MTPTSRRRSRHSFLKFHPEQLSLSRPFRKRSIGPQRVVSLGTENITHSNQDSNIDECLPIPDWKRGTDIVLVLLILPFVGLLAALVYCWIQLVSPGAVLFRQTRIGRGGKPFTIYKFRSMSPTAATNVHEAHVEHLIKSNKPMIKLDVTGDSRLIKGGCLIRTSGLDELPQFINVLRGEMSLVGPRPCLQVESELYDAHQRHRFAVQPGLTGLWQVSRTDFTTFSEMVEMDNNYVDRLAPIVDIQIILKTPFALLCQMKACVSSKVQKATRRPAITKTSPKPVSQPAYALSMNSTQRISD